MSRSYLGHIQLWTSSTGHKKGTVPLRMGLGSKTNNVRVVVRIVTRILSGGRILIYLSSRRPAYLEMFESRIRDLSASVNLSPDLQEAELHVTLEVDGRASYATIEVEYEGSTVVSQSVQTKFQQSNSDIVLKHPNLWWPHTFGKQHMYDLKATLHRSGGDRSIQDTATHRIGIRKVELIQHPFSDQDGTSFYSKVNDVPIFGAGSNWIPGDSFLPRISTDRYRKWVTAAKISN